MCRFLFVRSGIWLSVIIATVFIIFPIPTTFISIFATSFLCPSQSLPSVLATYLLPTSTAVFSSLGNQSSQMFTRLSQNSRKKKRCNHFVDSAGRTLACEWQSDNRLKRLVKSFIEGNHFPVHNSNDLHSLGKDCKQKLPTPELPSTDTFSTSNGIFKYTVLFSLKNSIRKPVAEA